MSPFLRCGCTALMLAAAGASVRAQEPDAALHPLTPSVAPPSHPAVTSAGWLARLNAGVTATGVHDSSLGWYNVVVPGISYAFSTHFTADLSLPVYPYYQAREQQTRGNQPPNPSNVSAGTLVSEDGSLGDLLMQAHAAFNPRFAHNLLTLAVTAPAGNSRAGLSTGRATVSGDDRLEHYFGRTGVIVDAGVGDSSALVNRLVTEDVSQLGPLAQFQAGLVHYLPRGIFLQSLAYEELPIGDQKTYARIMAPDRPALTIVTGRRVAEDNGITTSVAVPLSAHWTLSSTYNRSFRLRLDTVSTGITWTLRSTNKERQDSLVDRAMREAEAATPPLEKPLP